MRIGFNPHKDIKQEESNYIHQVIIPVYIPNEVGYFKDCFKILKICLESLFATTNNKTFVTIVNNGSSNNIRDYLSNLFEIGKIQEIIHTVNIGKLNAILKGLVGNSIELVTISDSDVLFLPNWQSETTKIFNQIPEVGVVGIVPQFKMFETNCGNVIFDNFFNKNFKFFPVKNKNALARFYESIGWDNSYNQDYLAYNLGLEINQELKVLVGSGHFVATYKKYIFKELTSFIGYKLGGNSESYLDLAPLKKGLWRLTTQDNYAYHMGNTFENWMSEQHNDKKYLDIELDFYYSKNKESNKLAFLFKNIIFYKILKNYWVSRLFLRLRKLPKEMIKTF